MVIKRYRKRTAYVRSLAAMVCAGLMATSAAAATTDPVERCGRAIVAGGSKILRADVQALRACTLAILEPAAPGEIEDACKKLRTPSLRLERIDARVRTRVAGRCSEGIPAWLPDECRGPGPAKGARLADPATLANCTASGSHCTALLTLDGTFEDALAPLSSQHPENLRFEFNGIPGNSFMHCLDGGSVTTTSTTSTSLSPATTTTTMVVPPPTSTTSTTTTLASPTTTSTTTTMEVTGTPQLVITEIMPNPAAQSDSAGEYFEVRNVGTSSVDILGLEVRDLGSDGFTVSGSVVIAAGGYAVFGKTGSAADGNVDYIYGSGMNLTNSSDAIVLLVGDEVLDQVAYDAGFPLASGRSMEVVPGAQNAVANDDPANWCASDSPLNDGDSGTPRRANEACLQ